MSIQDARDAARAGDFERATRIRARNGEMLPVKWSDVRWRWTYDHIMHLGTEREWWSFLVNLTLSAERIRFWNTYQLAEARIGVEPLTHEPRYNQRSLPAAFNILRWGSPNREALAERLSIQTGPNVPTPRQMLERLDEVGRSILPRHGLPVMHFHDEITYDAR